ncbi:MAG: VWA domain-containing protein [Acidobacteriia bacterium]|nr:VWA domain-containing protein [Terriglobia bacterium]
MKTKEWLKGSCLGVFATVLLLCAVNVPEVSGTQAVSPQAGPAAAVPVPQSKQQVPLSNENIIRVDVPIVNLDVVVKDKKGMPVKGLTKEDFEIREDDALQEIRHFEYYSEDQPVTQFASITTDQPMSPERMNYILFLFDNSSLDFSGQEQARKAAARFIDENLRPGDLVAIVNYRFSMQILQNFSENKARLARALGVIAGPEGSGVTEPGADANTDPLISRAQQNLRSLGAQFDARNLMLGMRELFNSLRTVKGRKSLIVFSGGVTLPPDNTIDLIAAIDAANKANVTVYTIDSKGLEVDRPTTLPNPRRVGFNLGPPIPSFGSFVNSFQGTPPRGGTPGGRGEPAPTPGGGTPGGIRPGGGTPGGTPGGGTPAGTPGGTPGGTRGGNPPGTPGNNPPDTQNPGNPNTPIEQRIFNERRLDQLTVNQLKDVLLSLAVETGGFYIQNTNDFAPGLQAIKSEMHNFYSLGYESSNKIHDGKFRAIKVGVRKKGLQVKYRKGYFDRKSQDALAGTPAEKPLIRAIGESAPLTSLPLRIVSDYFYEGAGKARAPVTIQLPISKLKMKRNKDLHTNAIDVLGVAFREDGSTAARFSDTIPFRMNDDRLKSLPADATLSIPSYFNLVPGKYRIKVAAHEEGDLVGTVEQPIDIPPYGGNLFTTSSLVLSGEVRPLSSLMNKLEAELFDEKDPMISNGTKIYQSPARKFTRGGMMCLYFALYNPTVDPALKQPTVLVSYSFISNGKLVFQSPLSPVMELPPVENGVLPVGMWIPLQELPLGHYIAHVTVRDGLTNDTRYLTDQFDVVAPLENAGKK